MSFLRLLSIRGTKTQCDDLKLTLRVPAYGTIFMVPPDDPLWPAAVTEGLPRNDQLFHGELDITVPDGLPRRCKSIRVGIRTTARLLMGPQRGWEEDVVFERMTEVIGGTSDGLLLEPGSQRFDFTLILPSTLAPHDWHQNGTVRHHLFAEVDGLPGSPSTLFSFSRSNRGSRGSLSSLRGSDASSIHLSGRTPSRSPSPPASPLGTAPQTSPLTTLNTTRQESGIPKAPSYAQSQADRTMDLTANEWLKGRYAVSRALAVLHNPNRTGGVCDLDERQSGLAPGIGVYDLKLFSDVFSIGGPVHARLTLPDLSPKTIIYSWRLLLAQTHTIRSPRDDPAAGRSISTTHRSTLVEHGTRPPLEKLNPGVDTPAIWRGMQAGGASYGTFKIEGDGTMPKDEKGRPSTLPGVITPIIVSHALVYEIFFSIWGEQYSGDTTKEVSGPGTLRFMKVERPIIVPSCCLVPVTLDLPRYDVICKGRPCPTCHQRRDQQLCTSCPPTILPHPRHDLPFELVGNSDGICPECSRSVLPQEDVDEPVEFCACGVDRKHLEERMRRFVLEGLEVENGDFGPSHLRKEEAERQTSRVA